MRQPLRLVVPLLVGFAAGWWCAQPVRGAEAKAPPVSDYEDDFPLDERMFCAKFRGASTRGGLDVVRRPPAGAPTRCLKWVR